MRITQWVLSGFLIVVPLSALAQKMLDSESVMLEKMFDAIVEDAWLVGPQSGMNYNPSCITMELLLKPEAVKSLTSIAFRVYSEDYEQVLFQTIHHFNDSGRDYAAVCVDSEYLDKTQVVFTIEKNGGELPGLLKNLVRSYHSYVYRDFYKKVLSYR